MDSLKSVKIVVGKKNASDKLQILYSLFLLEVSPGFLMFD